ncbi:hypothetical protein [Streptomyces formicae]|uniref:Integral membrane protein n=1 Tax=Streptomyces formicae TaxID=1616117 RepID=A0ABY3WCF8_9ACTN|nr:hypothetical protein [Streptomyces formicae]UNM10258.1 hypothetical protein J4032_00885 [Streptomyces formicae]
MRPSSPGAPRPPAPARDFSGAVHGSLLAASVIATAGALGPYPKLQLTIMLITTGLVFWLIHVYSRLVGHRLASEDLSWRQVREEARKEWPIAEAAFPPAAAVAVSPLLDLGPNDTVWLALGVALAGQVCWATAAVVRAGAARRLVVVTGAVNLLLGLVLVAMKAAVSH